MEQLDNLNLNYTLNNLNDNYDKSKISTIKNIFKINHPNYKIKKYLGNQDNYHIFVIVKLKTRDNNSENTTNIKQILKIIDLDSLGSINSDYFIKYQEKLMRRLKNNPSTRPFINNCYKINQTDNYVFLILQYFDSMNLEDIKENLKQLKTQHYVTIIQYLVKQILKGLDSIHKLNITHNNLSLNNIIINHQLDTNIQIKFINFNTPSRLLKKRNTPNKLSLLSKSIQDDNKECGQILLELITLKYEDQINRLSSLKKTKKKNNYSKLDKIFFNLVKKQKTIQDILPSKLYHYSKIINKLMIKKKTGPGITLSEILFYEKYNN